MKKHDYKVKRIVDQLEDLPDEAIPEVVDRVTDRAAKSVEPPKSGVVHIKELEPVLKEVRDSQGKMRGISTGYTSLDSRMGGLEKGSVIMVAGETGNGKSALATNIAVNVAREGTGVLYITLEMTKEQMLERLDIITEGSPLDLDLAFQQSFALNYKDLEPLLQNAKEQGQVDVVILDYLQYLGRGMTNEEVAKMSKEVKSLALRYDISFLVITSLRKSEGGKFRRKWNEVGVEDLMGTSAIAYDADVIMLASRKDPEDNEFHNDKLWARVLKSRNTALDYMDNIVEFEWDRTRITERWKTPVTKS